MTNDPHGPSDEAVLTAEMARHLLERRENSPSGYVAISDALRAIASGSVVCVPAAAAPLVLTEQESELIQQRRRVAERLKGRPVPANLDEAGAPHPAGDEPEFKLQPAVMPDGWCDWVMPVMDDYRMKCCDCGLVHQMEFHVATHEGVDRVEFRMRRESPAAAAAPREPVAWRWKERGPEQPARKWIYGDSPTKASATKLELEPLYASPASAPSAPPGAAPAATEGALWWLEDYPGDLPDADARNDCWLDASIAFENAVPHHQRGHAEWQTRIIAAAKVLLAYAAAPAPQGAEPKP